MFRIINRYKCTLATASATATASTYKPYDAIPGPKSYPLVGSIPNYLPGIGKKIADMNYALISRHIFC